MGKKYFRPKGRWCLKRPRYGDEKYMTSFSVSKLEEAESDRAKVGKVIAGQSQSLYVLGITPL